MIETAGSSYGAIKASRPEKKGETEEYGKIALEGVTGVTQGRAA